MERTYINEFHKQWMETTLQSIASWKMQPLSLNDVKRQQEKLFGQRQTLIDNVLLKREHIQIHNP